MMPFAAARPELREARSTQDCVSYYRHDASLSPTENMIGAEAGRDVDRPKVAMSRRRLAPVQQDPFNRPDFVSTAQ